MYEQILRERENELAEETLRQADTIRIAENAKIRKRAVVFFRFLIVLLIMAVLTCLIVYAVYKFIFVVTEFDVSGNDGILEEDIIKASGIVKGDNLYSFSPDKRAEYISFFIPEIKSAEIKRQIPNRLKINVELEEILFCAEIYGERYLITESLRIVKKCESHENGCAAQCILKLPVISKAISGNRIEFVRDRHEENVYSSVESILKSSLKDRVVCIDLRDGFNFTMVCDGKYLLSFGDYKDIDIKLKLADQILQDSMFLSVEKAILNLSDINSTVVTVDKDWTY